MARSRAWTRIAGCALAAAVLVTSGVAFAEGELKLAVQGLDTSAFPTVTFRATVPPAMAGDAEAEFEVEENGRSVPDVTVEHVRGDATPPDVVLVIDTSGSMRGKPLEDARTAATAFVGSLGTGARVGLVAFDDGVHVLALPGTDRAALLGEIARLTAKGETSLYDALAEAAAMVPASGSGQRAIVVLSDGGDTVSARSFESVVQSLKDVAVPVYAVALQSEEYNPQALATVADATAGRLIPVTESAQLAAGFEAIAEEIRDAYVLTYTSREPDTKDVEVDVLARSENGEAIAAIVYANPKYSWEPGRDGADASVRVLGADRRVLTAFIALAFGSAALLFFALLGLFTRERARLADLHYYDQLHGQDSGSAPGSAGAVRDRVVDAVASVAGRRGFIQVIGRKLEEAGLPLRPAEYITAHVIAVVALGGITQLLLGNIALSVGAVVLGSFGPIVALDIAAARRREAFEAQLPDILAMISGSLRGGWGLLQAVEFVVTQAGEPAASEFRRVQTEVRLGLPLEESLQAMGRRIQSVDLDAAVTAIVIQREVGGNLAEVLDIVARTVRERAALGRQVHALTAEGRLSAYILMALPFLEAFVLAVVSPGYLVPLLTTGPGVLMIIAALLLLVVGGLWLRAITRIEV